MTFKKGESGNPDGRPKGSKGGYTHSVKTLAQRQKNASKISGKDRLKAEFLCVPKNPESGEPLIPVERVKELYENNLTDFACEPVVALTKLGASLQTMLDMQSMLNAQEGKVLTKQILSGAKIVADLAKDLGKLKYGENKHVTVEHKLDGVWKGEKDLEFEVKTE